MYLCVMQQLQNGDTICALATAPGTGAIAVLRIAGPAAFQVVNAVFLPPDGSTAAFEVAHPYSIHFGQIHDAGRIVDEVLVSVFRAPRSYTGDDILEISCHGSEYIQQEILQLLQRHGARLAEPGEFTLRAFLNGKIDLSQAEAVADLIAARHATAHQAALQQLRGGYSDTMRRLRQQLIDFASLLELELDFAEEDVEFANREKLRALVDELLREVRQLESSFSAGNVMKHGVPVLIAGKPNVGKSTLLNALLSEERAIVSEIAGTTRDVIEDHLVVQGIRFRFMDTAGIRETDDSIERIGVERTLQHAAKAAILVYVCDPAQSDALSLQEEIRQLVQQSGNSSAPVIVVINKSDQYVSEELQQRFAPLPGLLHLSAKEGWQLDILKEKLCAAALPLTAVSGQTTVTNARHAGSLHHAGQALQKVIDGIDSSLSTDLLAFELRDAIHHIGNITGEVYTEDLLGNIFSRFCIGK